MTLNNIYTYIRLLAKSTDAQTFYSYAKEFHLQLFNNERDFTFIQLLYLRYLNFYSNLFLDIYLHEVDDLVLKDEIYEDAYMLFRNQNKISSPNLDTEQNKPAQSQWVFKQPKAKRTF